MTEKGRGGERGEGGRGAHLLLVAAHDGQHLRELCLEAASKGGVASARSGSGRKKQRSDRHQR